MRDPKVDSLKLFTHIAALVPLTWLVLNWLSGDLTANPIEDIARRTGKDALVLLILTLSCSPVANFTGQRQVLRIRRILGVYAFIYAGLHFLTFVGLDFGFDLALITEGLLQKPFAFVGLTTFIILLALTITSTNAWARRLGKNWKRLHRLVYIAAPLATIHFFWSRLAKLKTGEPIVYGALVLLLLITRIPAIKNLPRRR